MGRGSDFIRPSAEAADVMLLASETDEECPAVSPFWYAKILGVYSLFALQPGKPDTNRRIEFLRVRWSGREEEFALDDETMRQERIGFIKSTDNTQQ